MEMINSRGLLSMEAIPQGTNVYRLIIPERVDPEVFRRSLEGKQLFLPPPESSFPGFLIKTNETLLSADLDGIVELFEEALGR